MCLTGFAYWLHSDVEAYRDDSWDLLEYVNLHRLMKGQTHSFVDIRRYLTALKTDL